MKNFEVQLTCIYNGVACVQAETEEEAVEMVQQEIWDKGIGGFPPYINAPYGEFAFGEVSADYANEV